MSPNKDEVIPKDEGALASVGEDAALEEGLPPPQETAFHNDGDAAGKSAKGNRNLSVVSQKYDREGKGFLDEAQARMRQLDTSNRGYLTTDRVYEMMKEQLDMQKQMVTQKRLIIGLFIFSIVLALANMGTAFAAATLAKDTTVSGGSASVMVSKADGGLVGTGTVVDTIKVDREEHSQRRSLKNPNAGGGDPPTCDGELDGVDCTEDASGTIAVGVAERIYNECGGGAGTSIANTVTLRTACGNGANAPEHTLTLCNANGVSVSRSGSIDTGSYVYTYVPPTLPNNEIIIDCSGGGSSCSVNDFCPSDDSTSCTCAKTDCFGEYSECCGCDHCIIPGSEMCIFQYCCGAASI